MEIARSTDLPDVYTHVHLIVHIYSKVSNGDDRFDGGRTETETQFRRIEHLQLRLGTKPDFFISVLSAFSCRRLEEYQSLIDDTLFNIKTASMHVCNTQMTL